MPDNGSERLIKRAQALHAGCMSLLVEQVRLAPADVHQLRLSVKGLVALWQVLKPFLAEGQADAASLDIGHAAKLLSGARDQYVQIKTLDKQIRRAGEEELSALQLARELLIAQHSDLPEDALMTADIASRFAQDRERWQRLELGCSRRELIRDGYGRLYRKARKRFLKAARSGNAVDWHSLRRWTKYLAALALPVAADDSNAESAAKRYADLAGKLGDLHDLHVLAASLKSLPDHDESSIHQAIAVLEQRADLLQSTCHRKSKRLFRVRPKSKEAESIL
ncbi:MAG: CHAD domain-containing protein [Gammaproteobacteria bacterium]|nr:CHAD domain-containing protein [Gammaproteobacteria bacterium]